PLSQLRRHPPSSTPFPYTTLFRSHIKQSHPLFHQALSPRQADPALIGQQLADRANAPAAKMIDIIQDPFTLAQGNEIFHRADKVDRKSTRLNSSHEWISYAVFCLK